MLKFCGDHLGNFSQDSIDMALELAERFLLHMDSVQCFNEFGKEQAGEYYNPDLAQAWSEAQDIAVFALQSSNPGAKCELRLLPSESPFVKVQKCNEHVGRAY